MKDLKQVDIISINCVNPNEGALAIQYCQRFFNFGRSILFTDVEGSAEDIEIVNIKKLNSVDDYNNFVLQLGKYVDNEYVLVVQDDGYIVNPDLWDDQYLEYDYVGAPWPIEERWVGGFPTHIAERMRRVFPNNRVGNGGFSLRSKKFLDYSAQFTDCNGFGEDELLCQINYDMAVDFGIKFAPFELAHKFSYENPLAELGDPWGTPVSFDVTKHFGWHGKNFLNTQELINLKHMVKSVNESEWKEAQESELSQLLTDTAKEDCNEHGNKVIFEDHFGIDYKTYFVGKTIIESGGGRFPHVCYCDGAKNKISVEPLFDRLDDYCKEYQLSKGVEVVACAFEDYDPPEDLEVDEVWFFNVLQHVKDPALQIQKAKSIAKVVRVFEPIHVPTNIEHPHMFDVPFFQHHFPESTVKTYTPHARFAPFFGTECAYLEWTKESV